jgi:hypothetical protein
MAVTHMLGVLQYRVMNYHKNFASWQPFQCGCGIYLPMFSSSATKGLEGEGGHVICHCITYLGDGQHLPFWVCMRLFAKWYHTL